ncbi:MAG: hypothetical protein WCE21_03410 [Candidatus Babeliales bacterium]
MIPIYVRSLAIVLLVVSAHNACDASHVGRVGSEIRQFSRGVMLRTPWRTDSCAPFPIRAFHSNGNQLRETENFHSKEQKSNQRDFKKRSALGAGVALGAAFAWGYNRKEQKDSEHALVKRDFAALGRIGEMYKKRAQRMPHDSVEANIYAAVYFTTQENGAAGLAHMESVLTKIIAEEANSALQSEQSAYLLGGEGNAQRLDIASREKAIQLINESQLPVIIMQVSSLEYLEYPEFGEAFLKSFSLMQMLDVCKTIGKQAMHDIAIYETKGNDDLLKQFRNAPSWQEYEQIKSIIPLHDVPTAF